MQNILLPKEQTRIAQGSQVKLHFEVSLENGHIIDSTFQRSEPVTLTIGDGNLLEGFEKVLINLQAGDIRTAHLSPTDAFGEWLFDNVQNFSPNQFILTNAQPEVGMMIEFEDKSNATLVGVVSEITKDNIKIDFNHPLAGKNVIFKVQIFSVIPKNNQAIKGL